MSPPFQKVMDYKGGIKPKVELFSKPTPTHIFKLFPTNIWILNSDSARKRLLK